MKRVITMLTLLMFGLATFTEATASTYQDTTKKTKSGTLDKRYSANKHLKKDGTMDMRYKSSKHVKKDGTMDMRYKSSKKVTTKIKKDTTKKM